MGLGKDTKSYCLARILYEDLKIPINVKIWGKICNSFLKKQLADLHFLWLCGIPLLCHFSKYEIKIYFDTKYSYPSMKLAVCLSSESPINVLIPFKLVNVFLDLGSNSLLVFVWGLQTSFNNSLCKLQLNKMCL